MTGAWHVGPNSIRPVRVRNSNTYQQGANYIIAIKPNIGTGWAGFPHDTTQSGSLNRADDVLNSVSCTIDIARMEHLLPGAGGGGAGVQGQLPHRCPCRRCPHHHRCHCRYQTGSRRLPACAAALWDRQLRLLHAAECTCQAARFVHLLLQLAARLKLAFRP